MGCGDSGWGEEFPVLGRCAPCTLLCVYISRQPPPSSVTQPLGRCATCALLCVYNSPPPLCQNARPFDRCALCALHSTSLPGSGSATDCTCVPGFYTAAGPGGGGGTEGAGSDGGGPACAACAPGTYKAAVGPAACDTCPPGTVSAAVGATSADVCRCRESEEKKYADIGKKLESLLCPNGGRKTRREMDGQNGRENTRYPLQ